MSLPAHADGPLATLASRISSLDVLRGFALLGILLMNVQSVSMPIAAYFNPTAYGAFSGENAITWFLVHVPVDQKFMTRFSILFGAGNEQTMEAFQKNFPTWVEKRPRPGRGAEGSS